MNRALFVDTLWFPIFIEIIENVLEILESHSKRIIATKKVVPLGFGIISA